MSSFDHKNEYADKLRDVSARVRVGEPPPCVSEEASLVHFLFVVPERHFDLIVRETRALQEFLSHQRSLDVFLQRAAT